MRRAKRPKTIHFASLRRFSSHQVALVPTREMAEKETGTLRIQCVVSKHIKNNILSFIQVVIKGEISYFPTIY
jgi:hypothetical protein